MDAIIIAVAHQEYLQLNEEQIGKLFRAGSYHNRVLIDVKGILHKKKYEDLGYQYWSL
jgi:UDP-N-acetyl-D-galactosamine dehydrogenase